MTERILVVGSVNLDFVAAASKLPAPGETVTGAKLTSHPGGKGANQALAARRLGAQVALQACVGLDAMAEEALTLLRADGVDLSRLHVDPQSPTGVALIAVSADGENQIVVAPGANDRLLPDLIETIDASVLLMQLEVPIPTVVRAAEKAKGLVILNLAPAIDVPHTLLQRADVLIVNEGEAHAYGPSLDGLGALIVTTLGERGARMVKGGRLVAESPAPKITAVDTTGAGDAFAGAFTVALLERRTGGEALAFACAAGALAATRAGAQTSLPWRSDVEAMLRGA